MSLSPLPIVKISNLGLPLEPQTPLGTSAWGSDRQANPHTTKTDPQTYCKL